MNIIFVGDFCGESLFDDCGCGMGDWCVSWGEMWVLNLVILVCHEVVYMK